MNSRSTKFFFLFFFSNVDPRLTFDVFMTRSNLRPHAMYGENVDKSFSSNVLKTNC